MRTTYIVPYVGDTHKPWNASDFSDAPKNICSAELPRSDAGAADAEGMPLSLTASHGGAV